MSERIGPEGSETNRFVVGEITGEFVHGQEFTASSDGLCGIRLLAATFGRPAAGVLEFRLYDAKEGTGRTLVSRDRDCSSLKDNEWMSIEFPAIGNSKGRRFGFTLACPRSIPGTAPTVWADESEGGYGETRFLMGLEVPGILCFRAVYKGGEGKRERNRQREPLTSTAT